MSVTKSVVDFILDTDFEDVPEKVVTMSKRSILDCLGVACAGSAQEISSTVLDYLRFVGGVEQSTVLGMGYKTSCTGAAFANGVMGHVLDYDDICWHGVTHSTVVVLPAILAIGELVGASGKDVLNAYSIGYEVISRLGKGLVESGNHYAKGFHSTGTLGIFGATAAAGKLLGLDPDQMTYALGLAGSQASGLKVMFGSMSKPFQAGHAAEGGVRASLLAEKGFDSTREIFEGQNAFTDTTSDKYDLDKITDGLGSQWGILDDEKGVIFKMFPVWGGGGGSVDTILSIVKKNAIDPGRVESVECWRRNNAFGTKYPVPKTGFEAKFSIHFWLAIGLLDGKVGLEQFVDEKVLDPRTQELMGKVKLLEDSDIGRGTRIKVKMDDGTEYQDMVWPQRGAPDNPPTDDELKEKFMTCTRVGGLKAQKASKAVDLILGLENVDDVSQLINAFEKK